MQSRVVGACRRHRPTPAYGSDVKARDVKRLSRTSTSAEPLDPLPVPPHIVGHEGLGSSYPEVEAKRQKCSRESPRQHCSSSRACSSAGRGSRDLREYTHKQILAHSNRLPQLGAVSVEQVTNTHARTHARTQLRNCSCIPHSTTRGSHVSGIRGYPVPGMVHVTKARD